MKLTTNFQLHEFVHPDHIEILGDRSADWLNPNLATTVQDLRDLVGQITICDWYWGGRFKDSGLRLITSVGAAFSAHKGGCAADLKFKNRSPIDVQEMIMENQYKFPYISRMENAEITKTWLHCEVSTNRNKAIKIYNP